MDSAAPGAPHVEKSLVVEAHEVAELGRTKYPKTTRSTRSHYGPTPPFCAPPLTPCVREVRDDDDVRTPEKYGNDPDTSRSLEPPTGPRTCSATPGVDSAASLQAGGPGFDSSCLHHRSKGPFRSTGRASDKMSTVTAQALGEKRQPTAPQGTGAFFTPALLCEYVVNWAIRSADDQVLEPSCGDPESLIAAAEPLSRLGGSVEGAPHGVELVDPRSTPAT